MHNVTNIEWNLRRGRHDAHYDPPAANRQDGLPVDMPARNKGAVVSASGALSPKNLAVSNRPLAARSGWRRRFQNDTLLYRKNRRIGIWQVNG
jgi:hypothetical protein